MPAVRPCQVVGELVILVFLADQPAGISGADGVPGRNAGEPEAENRRRQAEGGGPILGGRRSRLAAQLEVPHVHEPEFVDYGGTENVRLVKREVLRPGLIAG